MNILIIDDNEAEFIILQAYAKESNVYHSFDGKDIDISISYDLIIIDINLGVESGFSVYNKLKKIIKAKYIIVSSFLPDVSIALDAGDTIINKSKLLLAFKSGEYKEWMD